MSRRHMVVQLTLGLTLILAGLLVLSAIPSSLPGADADAGGVSKSSSEPSLSYVALGDSFTAGPGLLDQASPSGCKRSSENYPAQVAAALGAQLRDVSCGGADHRDLMIGQRLRDGSRVAPQLAALDRRTDLVTLGLGANEFGLFAQVFGRCDQAAEASTSPHPCRDRFTRRVGRDGQEVDTKLRDAHEVLTTTRTALRQVRDRAPSARLLVVGYPRIVPAAGDGCLPLPFTPADVAWLRAVWEQVNLSLRRAARAEGAEYVDPDPGSQAHGPCAAQPWVNGARPAPGSGARFHPTPAGMTAMAELVLEQARRPAPDPS